MIEDVNADCNLDKSFELPGRVMQSFFGSANISLLACRGITQARTTRWVNVSILMENDSEINIPARRSRIMTLSGYISN
jgi:hypothetical protein